LGIEYDCVAGKEDNDCLLLAEGVTYDACGSVELSYVTAEVLTGLGWLRPLLTSYTCGSAPTLFIVNVRAHVSVLLIALYVYCYFDTRDVELACSLQPAAASVGHDFQGCVLSITTIFSINANLRHRHPRLNTIPSRLALRCAVFPLFLVFFTVDWLAVICTLLLGRHSW